MGDYDILQVPAQFRGPSGEPHQALIGGLVNSVRLFHGRSDEELDWHVFFTPDEAVVRDLGLGLRELGEPVNDDHLAELYCEIMIIDDWHRRSVTWPPWQASFQRKYTTADFTPALSLESPGSAHPALDLAHEAADEPGKTYDLSAGSRLAPPNARARVYMQGLLVRDIGHDSASVEVHPPDSLAYAMTADGRVIPEDSGCPEWPTREVIWRVAWFGNSSHHRVNDLNPLKQERTTTWYLPLPSAKTMDVLASPSVVTRTLRLWDQKNEEWYDDRGVAAFEEPRFEIDPADNQLKLRVSCTMRVPGERGGMIVRDFVVARRDPLISAPAVTEASPR